MAEATATDITAPEEGATNRTTVVTVENKGPLSIVRRIMSDQASAAHAAILGVALTIFGLIAFYFLNKPPVTTLYAGVPMRRKRLGLLRRRQIQASRST